MPGQRDLLCRGQVALHFAGDHQAVDTHSASRPEWLGAGCERSASRHHVVHNPYPPAGHSFRQLAGERPFYVRAALSS